MAILVRLPFKKFFAISLLFIYITKSIVYLFESIKIKIFVFFVGSFAQRVHIAIVGNVDLFELTGFRFAT